MRNNVFHWGANFLGVLEKSAAARLEKSTVASAPLPTEQFIAAYRSAKHRVILLDYDGTLVPFTRRPQDAEPDSDLLDILDRLSSDPANSIVLISGRKVADLEHWFGHLAGLGLAAEHGACLRSPGTSEWRRSVQP